MDKNTKTKYACAFIVVVTMAIFGCAFKFQSEKMPENFYPETLIITEAVHTPDWTGYFQGMRYSDWKRMGDGKTYYNHIYRISEDPEDLEKGDVISVIMDTKGTSEIKDDKVIKYQVSHMEYGY